MFLYLKKNLNESKKRKTIDRLNKNIKFWWIYNCPGLKTLQEKPIKLKKAKEEILKNLDDCQYISCYENSEKQLHYGDFLLSCADVNGERYIGYIVQIRKKWGELDSDQFYLRLPDGNLCIHEGTSFWKLSDKQVRQVAPLFSSGPQIELSNNPKLGYSENNKARKKGFVVAEKYTRTSRQK